MEDAPKKNLYSIVLQATMLLWNVYKTIINNYLQVGEMFQQLRNVEGFFFFFK